MERFVPWCPGPVEPKVDDIDDKSTQLRVNLLQSLRGRSLFGGVRISGFLDIKFDIVDTVFGTAVSGLLSPS